MIIIHIKSGLVLKTIGKDEIFKNARPSRAVVAVGARCLVAPAATAQAAHSAQLSCASS